MMADWATSGAANATQCSTDEPRHRPLAPRASRLADSLRTVGHELQHLRLPVRRMHRPTSCSSRVSSLDNPCALCIAMPAILARVTMMT
jgi:hypothetical protein